MFKRISLVGLSLALGLTLAACGPDETAKKVDDPKEESSEESGKNSNNNENGLDAIKGKSLDEITAEDWAKINLSKKQFEEFLSTLTEPDKETGEININKVEMLDDSTIEIILNNSDGDTFENQILSPIMDAFVREVYKHSAFYKDKEPTIIVKDLTGYKIMENDKPLELNEGQTENNLGTFQVGDKVDVAGTVITINNISYTDERNEFDEYQPEKVLKIDLTVQNSTNEELFFDVFEFELYDAEGTKMEFVSLDNMTETLQPGKNASGSAYIGASGKGPYELYYSDFVTGTKAMWKINVE